MLKRGIAGLLLLGLTACTAFADIRATYPVQPVQQFAEASTPTPTPFRPLPLTPTFYPTAQIEVAATPTAKAPSGAGSAEESSCHSFGNFWLDRADNDTYPFPEEETKNSIELPSDFACISGFKVGRFFHEGVGWGTLFGRDGNYYTECHTVELGCEGLAVDGGGELVRLRGSGKGYVIFDAKMGVSNVWMKVPVSFGAQGEDILVYYPAIGPDDVAGILEEMGVDAVEADIRYMNSSHPFVMPFYGDSGSPLLVYTDNGVAAFPLYGPGGDVVEIGAMKFPEVTEQEWGRVCVGVSNGDEVRETCIEGIRKALVYNYTNQGVCLEGQGNGKNASCVIP